MITKLITTLTNNRITTKTFLIGTVLAAIHRCTHGRPDSALIFPDHRSRGGGSGRLRGQRRVPGRPRKPGRQISATFPPFHSGITNFQKGANGDDHETHYNPDTNNDEDGLGRSWQQSSGRASAARPAARGKAPKTGAKRQARRSPNAEAESPAASTEPVVRAPKAAARAEMKALRPAAEAKRPQPINWRRTRLSTRSATVHGWS